MKEISYEGPSFFEKGKAQKALRSRGSAVAPTIRTFRADVEELIEEKGTTKAQVLIAETARREVRGESRVQNESKPHLGIIIFILFLVLAFGIGVGAYVLIGTKIGLNVPITEAPLPLSQKPATIQINNSPREQIMADISINFGKTTLAVGSNREVNFVTTPEGESERNATTAEILEAVSVRMPPESLIRSLGDKATFGIHVEVNALVGYLAFPTLSYANTFAGMLDWENSMATELIPVTLPWYPRKDISNIEGKAFLDERIAGVDARVLRNEYGKILLIYTFIDRKQLLITSGEETLSMFLASTNSTTATSTTP